METLLLRGEGVSGRVAQMGLVGRARETARETPSPAGDGDGKDASIASSSFHRFGLLWRLKENG